ncbi:MAG: CRTAC1 family protein [Sinimarinibacterium sp.]
MVYAHGVSSGSLRAALVSTAVLLAVSGCGGGSRSSDPSPGPTPPPAVTCAEPVLKAASPGPAGEAAAGRGQMFEQIEIPGLTDVQVIDGNGGVALTDVNRDGQVDILLVNAIAPMPDALNLFINRGCWQFEREAVTVTNADALTADNNAIPTFADFNDDGLLDLYLTSDPVANFLFLARGDYKTFEEVGTRMGVDNDTAYSRQAQFADVNGDGWLDIAVGSDQIGDMTVIKGVPWQRLYVYKPGGAGFEAGLFEDIGGTDLIPDFGGEPNSDPEHDRASPTILVRDIDDDSDLDVVQSYHDDMLLAHWFHPDATGENRHGVYVWKNQLADAGQFRYEQELPGNGGLAEVGWSVYNPTALVYDPVQHAVSHPYLSSADVDNDGRLDLLTVGPTDYEWHVHTDSIGAKFWHNEGGGVFRAALDEFGLGSLDYTYDQWAEHFGLVFDDTDQSQASSCLLLSNQIPKCINRTKWDWKFYHADSIWADFNNDGWIDLLAVDRHEVAEGFGVFRNVLYLNQGNGRFAPVRTEISGIDENSVAAEVADLNGDGLLDLYFMTQIRNSYPFFSYLPNVPDAEYQDKVYWNTGAQGGVGNHWVQIRLVGAPQRQLIGAKLFLRKASGQLLGRRDLFPVTSYKSSVDLSVHFGLGAETRAGLRIELPDGRTVEVAQIPIDGLIEVDVATGAAKLVRRATVQLGSAVSPSP